MKYIETETLIRLIGFIIKYYKKIMFFREFYLNLGYKWT